MPLVCLLYVSCPPTAAENWPETNLKDSPKETSGESQVRQDGEKGS